MLVPFLYHLFCAVLHHRTICNGEKQHFPSHSCNSDTEQKSCCPESSYIPNNVPLEFPLDLLFLFWSRADSVETLLDILPSAEFIPEHQSSSLPLSEQDCHTQVSGHLISAPPPHLIPQYSWPRSLNPNKTFVTEINGS